MLYPILPLALMVVLDDHVRYRHKLSHMVVVTLLATGSKHWAVKSPGKSALLEKMMDVWSL
jgi:uncharacterized membrane protein YqjE